MLGRRLVCLLGHIQWPRPAGNWYVPTNSQALRSRVKSGPADAKRRLGRGGGAASGFAGPGDAVGFGECRGAVRFEVYSPVLGVNNGVMFGA